MHRHPQVGCIDTAIAFETSRYSDVICLTEYRYHPRDIASAVYMVYGDSRQKSWLLSGLEIRSSEDARMARRGRLAMAA